MASPASSRPAGRTRARIELIDAKWPELKVVPFIRPYRVRSDIQTWFNDPAIFELIKSEYARGYYRGIGEFHIYGKARRSGLGQEDGGFRGRAEPLSACPLRRGRRCSFCSATIRRRASSGRIPDFRYAPARVANCSTSIKDALWGELSYRGGITGGDGKLTTRLARLICTLFRPLPARLRHLDQRALVRLRHDLQGISRLARADSRRAGRRGSQTATRCGCSGTSAQLMRR